MRVCPNCHIFVPETEAKCPRDGEPAVEVEPEAIPAALSERFAFVDNFSQGGSGTAYVVDDTLTGRHGLLKVLRFQPGAYAAERMRIKRELAKQTSLSDSTVAQIIASGETAESSQAGKSLWFFREMVDGESLRLVLMREGPLKIPTALAIAAQIASGLDVLHRAGLIHRDLKPGHVICQPHLSGIPRVTVIDTGIVARIETNSLFELMGTAAYISPEQAAGRLVSFRSDLYSLGCILYEMLVGETPFAGETAEALLEAHRSTPAPVPPVALPDALYALLAALLAKDPRERPFSANQVRRTLDPLLPQAMPSGKPSAVPIGALSRSSSIPPLKTGSGIPSPVIAPPPQNERQSVPPPPSPDRAASAQIAVGSRASAPESLTREPVADPEEQELGTGEFDVLMDIPGISRKAPATKPSDQAAQELIDELSIEDAEPEEAATEIAIRSDVEEMQIEPDQPAGVTDTSPTRLISSQFLEAVLEASAKDTPEEGAEESAAITQDAATAAGNYESMPEAKAGGGGSAGYFQPETPYEEGESSGAEPLLYQRHSEGGAAYQSGAENQQAGADDWEGEDAGPRAVADPFGTQAIAVPLVRDRRIMYGVVGGLVVAALLLLFIGEEQPSEFAMNDVPAQTPGASPAKAAPSAPAKAAPAGEAPKREEIAPPAQPAGAETAAPDKPGTPDETVEKAAVEAENDKPEPEDTSGDERPSRRKAAASSTQPRVASSRDRPVIENKALSASTVPAVAARGAPVDRTATAEELREAGRQHYSAGRYPEAARAYRESTRYAPSHAGSYAGLGASLLAIKDVDGAIAAYQRAIQIQPRSSGFHAALGRAYFAKGDGGRATAAYRKALEINPDNKIAKMALVRLGQPQ